jgi:prepilin-type N-terminal cleavage/methylation domain-containing protein
MTRLSGDRGFTLVELLLGMTLMLVISSVTLTTFERFTVNINENQDRADDGERARNAIDLLARDVRSATAYQTTANQTGASVLRAGSDDFVFKSVRPASSPTSANPYGVQTVRYCLSQTGELIRQTRPDAVVPAAACPDPQWAATAVVSNVVNGSRPVFSYDSTVAAEVSSVSQHLFIDATPGRDPVETSLRSAVFLRNVNRAPTAEFSATAGPARHVQLNGSASVDPDNGLLTYAWKDNGVALPQTGPVIDYVAATAGSHTFTLTVTDRGGLSSTVVSTVTVFA